MIPDRCCIGPAIVLIISLDASGEFAILAARCLLIPLSLSASYCLGFFTFADFEACNPLLLDGPPWTCIPRRHRRLTRPAPRSAAARGRHTTQSIQFGALWTSCGQRAVARLLFAPSRGNQAPAVVGSLTGLRASRRFAYSQDEPDSPAREHTTIVGRS
jgi:hypothetical protein